MKINILTTSNHAIAYELDKDDTIPHVIKALVKDGYSIAAVFVSDDGAVGRWTDQTEKYEKLD